MGATLRTLIAEVAMNRPIVPIIMLAALGALGAVAARGETPQAPPPATKVQRHPIIQFAAEHSAPAHRTAAAQPPKSRAHAAAARRSIRSIALLSAAVLGDAVLAKERGGTDTHLSQNNSNGAVSGNVASQLTTGSNSISSSAFSNASGIPIVIQNTGNNVLIQNSTILNLQLTGQK